MRADFAKQLTERERIHHADHYHNYRNKKGPSGAWNDDEVGGREGMRVRYNHGYDRKSFNENLNPLRSWVHSGLGKNWDKYYGTLRQQFDARRVINKHILEHLFDYVEIHTHVGEKGAIMFMDTRYTNKGEQPIKACYKDYYVCPKSGMLRQTNKQPRRSVVKEAEANKLKAAQETKRYLDKHNVLHLIDGVWYHFELKEVPTVQIRYLKPANKDTFLVGYRLLGRGQLQKTWDELNQAEREQLGTATIVGGTARDLFTNAVVYKDQKGYIHNGNSYLYRGRDVSRRAPELYHATKATANHKQLKAAGLVK